MVFPVFGVDTYASKEQPDPGNPMMNDIVPWICCSRRVVIYGKLS